MSKRRQQLDDRWERTSGGGLFVPRRPALPTRRYAVGPLGGIKCCCVDAPCEIWSITRPDSVLCSITGMADDNCNTCENFNREDVECDYTSSTDTPLSGVCVDLYETTLGDGVVRVYFYHFYGSSYWSVRVYSNCNNMGCPVPYTGYTAGRAEDVGQITSGTYYPVIDIVPSYYQSGWHDACSIAGASAEVVVP